MIKIHYYNKRNLCFWLPLCILIVLTVCLTPLSAHAGFEQEIYSLFLGVFGFFTGLAGVLLNLSIDSLVIEMGENIPIEAVNLAWEVVRDVFNLAFIFGLIYIGIKTIISPDSSDPKRQLALIVIAAILINFSLFITKTVVDFANLTSVQINSFLASDGNKPILATDIDNTGVSTAFMERMGLVQLLGTKEGLKLAEDVDIADRTLVFALCASIFLLIAAFVFAAGAILLAVRFVALILIMIASPIMFLGMIFPKFDSHASRWWSMLFSHAFFAPIYLFLLYLSLLMLDEFRDKGLFGGNIGDLLYNPGKVEESAFGVFLGFLIICILMIASLVVAKNTGVAGGAMAVSMLKTVGTKARKGVQRGGAWTARKSVGLASHPFRAGTRKGVGAASRWASKKFDAWQAREGDKVGLATSARGVLRATNLDRSFRNILEAGQKIKVGTSYSYKDNLAYAKERKIILGEAGREEKIEKRLASGVKTEAETTELVDAIKSITVSQIKDKDKDVDINLLTKEEVAIHLSTKQVDALAESGKYSENEIKKVKDAREKGIKLAAASTGSEAVRKALVSKRSVDEITKLPAAVFTEKDMAKYLTPEMIEERMRKTSDPTELSKITKNIQSHLDDQGTSIGDKKRWRAWSKTNRGAQLNLKITEDMLKERHMDMNKLNKHGKPASPMDMDRLSKKKTDGDGDK